MKVAHRPLDAMEKGNMMAEEEPNKKCSLYIIHSKFFNITKDAFCATLFKSMQVWCCGSLLQTGLRAGHL
jgi:hypothetical protein